MIWAIFNAGTLLVGSSLLSDMKKCPPALLLALGSIRYDASLWALRIVLLALNVTIMSGYVAT